MRTRRSATISDLRLAIDCLPRPTREAMLHGINSQEIIVGAYSDGGGICPMLAAHRYGGRTDFISFARAWDRFAFRGARVHVSRKATERELLVLRTHLEASLLEDDGPAPDLAEAMAEHRELTRRRAEAAAEADEPTRRRSRDAERRRPGDADRMRELSDRPGWAWMRVFRRYDEYERALARLQAEEQAIADRAARDERELVG
jgi:hypothetical protein